MAGTAYPKRAIKQNRRTTRAKIGKPVKLARMGEIDYTFLFIVILLLSFGLVMLLSASAPAGNTLHNNSYYFFNKQFLCAILGLIGMWVISRIDYNKYKNTVPKFMIVCTILLVCVLIPGLGVKLNGSRRWLNTPFLQLQPSEFMKPVIAMYFARLVDSGKYNLKHLKGNLPYIGVMLIVVGLMLMETHLSGAIVIAGIGVSVMIAGGTPIKPVLIGALILLPIGLIGVRALSGVRWARVTSLRIFVPKVIRLCKVFMRLARAVFSDLAWDRVYRNIRIYLNRIMTLYSRLFVRNLVLSVRLL